MMTDRDAVRPAAWRAIPIAVVLLAGLVSASGCSSVPDAVNPVEWYHGVESWFESDEERQIREAARTARETAPPLPGANRDYPNLSTVPERPKSVSTSYERGRIERGLAADRENARYAEPEAGRPTGADVGAPIAVPRTPVTRQPVPPGPPGANSRESLPLDPQPMPSVVPPDQRSSLEDSDPAMIEPGPRARERPMSARSAEPATGAQGSFQTAAARPAAPAVAHSTNAPPAMSPAVEPRVAKAAPPPPPAEAMAQTASLPVGNWPTRSTDGLPRAFLIHFEGGSAQIDRADRETLREVLRIYKNRGGPLKVIGHASNDNRDSDSLRRQLANFRVSSQRAESVARELANLGVARADMIIGAVSDSEPIYGESSPQGAAGNRRVEVFFIP